MISQPFLGSHDTRTCCGGVTGPRLHMRNWQSLQPSKGWASREPLIKQRKIMCCVHQLQMSEANARRSEKGPSQQNTVADAEHPLCCGLKTCKFQMVGSKDCSFFPCMSIDVPSWLFLCIQPKASLRIMQCMGRMEIRVISQGLFS